MTPKFRLSSSPLLPARALLACALPAAAQASITIMGGVDAGTRRGGTLFGNARSRRTASLGYDYRLAKRTDFYTVAMRDRITTLPSAMSHGAGVRHSF